MPRLGRASSAVVSGHPNPSTSSAAALLSYDVPHKAPWDWRVSLYTWTKGIAAGAYLVPLLLVITGLLPPDSVVWRWVTPMVAGAFLGFTGLLLIWDLEHPARFLYIFRYAQLRSWLVRGAFIIGGYSAVLGGHFLFAVLGAPIPAWLGWIGLPLALGTAIYTAYLLAQAKARDLWQNPVLPVQLLVQAVLVGTAAVLPFVARFEPGVVNPLLWVLAASAALHLLVVAGEMTLTHATAHARLAAHEMTGGRYRHFFRWGMALTLAAVAAPWIGLAAVPLALAGLLAYEHAYIQAGQSVPLA